MITKSGETIRRLGGVIKTNKNGWSGDDVRDSLTTFFTTRRLHVVMSMLLEEWLSTIALPETVIERGSLYLLSTFTPILILSCSRTANELFVLYA